MRRFRQNKKICFRCRRQSQPTNNGPRAAVPSSETRIEKRPSETITSVDSDSSGRLVTKHKTSASSKPVSPPVSELNSPLLQADVLASKIKTDHSADNSDAFLTAMSYHLTTAGLVEVFNTAMERSERSFRESDTSHNSTLRMDQSGVENLPYEEPPPLQLDDEESGW